MCVRMCVRIKASAAEYHLPTKLLITIVCVIEASLSPHRSTIIIPVMKSPLSAVTITTRITRHYYHSCYEVLVIEMAII